MTDQEVQLFLADLAIIILLVRLPGMAAKRLGQPPVPGEIIAGILLGPTLFHGKITADGGAHLAVLAGTQEASDDLRQRVRDRSRFISVDVDTAAARGHRRLSPRVTMACSASSPARKAANRR